MAISEGMPPEGVKGGGNFRQLLKPKSDSKPEPWELGAMRFCRDCRFFPCFFRSSSYVLHVELSLNDELSKDMASLASFLQSSHSDGTRWRTGLSAGAIDKHGCADMVSPTVAKNTNGSYCEGR